MPENERSNRILTDAKAAADAENFTSFGLAVGQAPLDEAHTPTSLSFNTGALYLDTAPFGSRPEQPATGARAGAEE